MYLIALDGNSITTNLEISTAISEIKRINKEIDFMIRENNTRDIPMKMWNPPAHSITGIKDAKAKRAIYIKKLKRLAEEVRAENARRKLEAEKIKLMEVQREVETPLEEVEALETQALIELISQQEKE